MIHYLNLITLIRSYIPDAYISTDIIVGFPGETEENFMDTYNLINEAKYDGVFAFMFSRRSGTIADTLPNQIDEETKKDRIHRLLALSKSITKSYLFKRCLINRRISFVLRRNVKRKS